MKFKPFMGQTNGTFTALANGGQVLTAILGGR
ncbi:hypothetical protein QF047_001679 [Arthrobacter sp. W4I7]|nr:hypothetical protein [Arthrobacter sp. W4I7]